MNAAAPSSPSATLRLTSAHRRRLREVWRADDAPRQDALEIELLALGLLERHQDGTSGRRSIRVTDAGMQALADSAARHQVARSQHDALVEQISLALQAEDRIVWRGLSLDAAPPGLPVAPDEARPDVYSIRHTTDPDDLQPLVHEIRISRADLLADLKRPHRRAVYHDMAAGLYYVLADGIAEAAEIPSECGVIMLKNGQLQTLRPATMRRLYHRSGLPFTVWMALARNAPAPHPQVQPRPPSDDPLENTGSLGDE
ncbi:MAG: hypothetical protein RLZZ592_2686 [Pseudomonadota bacterium]|jgi:hypothetical protein|nr:hypothetical protein [Pseudomonadota bacterium]